MPTHEHFKKLFDDGRFYTKQVMGTTPVTTTDSMNVNTPVVNPVTGRPLMAPVADDDGKIQNQEAYQFARYAPLLLSDNPPEELRGLAEQMWQENGDLLANQPAKYKQWLVTQWLMDNSIPGREANSRPFYSKPNQYRSGDAGVRPKGPKIINRINYGDMGADVAFALASSPKAFNTAAAFPGTFNTLGAVSAGVGPALNIGESLMHTNRRIRDARNPNNPVRLTERFPAKGLTQRIVGDTIRGTHGKDIHDTNIWRQMAGAGAQVFSGAAAPITQPLEGMAGSIGLFGRGQVARGTVGGALSGLGGFMGWRMAKPLVKPMLRLAGRTAIRGAFLPAYAIGGALQQTADLTGESRSRTAEIYGNAKLQDSLLANRMYRQDQERGRDPRLTVQQRADQGSDHAKMLLRNMPDYRNMAYNEATQKYINDRSTQTKDPSTIRSIMAKGPSALWNTITGKGTKGL